MSLGEVAVSRRKDFFFQVIRETKARVPSLGAQRLQDPGWGSRKKGFLLWGLRAMHSRPAPSQLPSDLT